MSLCTKTPTKRFRLHTFWGMGFFLPWMLCGGDSPAWAWNAFGHELVAQIALDQLSPQERRLFEQDNQILNRKGAHESLVESAPWLDHLRTIKWNHHRQSLGPWHYIDIPYSPHQSVRRKANHHMNAVLAVIMAQKILADSQSNAWDRGIALRILWHVVGDIHQPMHCIQYIDAMYPKGDKGGNLYPLGPNAWGKNLHAYWDNGGGYLLKPRKPAKNGTVKHIAKEIEARWPCPKNLDLNPDHWAKESYHIAIDVAYQIPEYSVPTNAYEQAVVSTTKERIALAGCRLAAVAKQIYLARVALVG